MKNKYHDIIRIIAEARDNAQKDMEVNYVYGSLVIMIGIYLVFLGNLSNNYFLLYYTAFTFITVFFFIIFTEYLKAEKRKRNIQKFIKKFLKEKKR